jgi:hypothetical protein
LYASLPNAFHGKERAPILWEKVPLRANPSLREIEALSNVVEFGCGPAVFCMLPEGILVIVVGVHRKCDCQVRVQLVEHVPFEA